jgi:predicted transcriptional regulator
LLQRAGEFDRAWRAAPRLTVLATRREALGITGERVRGCDPGDAAGRRDKRDDNAIRTPWRLCHPRLRRPIRSALDSGGWSALGALFGPMVCWHTMKRTTVKLPDDLDARLRHEAQRRGVTISDVTREAIEEHLGGRRGGTRRLLAAAAGRSSNGDVSVRIEEILRAEVHR